MAAVIIADIGKAPQEICLVERTIGKNRSDDAALQICKGPDPQGSERTHLRMSVR